MKEVGKRLKALRESLGLSQVKMAEALGSTQSSINRYENGQSTPPCFAAMRITLMCRWIISLPARTSHRGSPTHLSPKPPRNGKKCAVSLKCVLTPNRSCMRS